MSTSGGQHIPRPTPTVASFPRDNTDAAIFDHWTRRLHARLTVEVAAALVPGRVLPLLRRRSSVPYLRHSTCYICPPRHPLRARAG